VQNDLITWRSTEKRSVPQR